MLWQHIVEVCGKSYAVTTRQQSNTVWITVGEYMGETIQTKGRTKGAAVKRWRERAHFKWG